MAWEIEEPEKSKVGSKWEVLPAEPSTSFDEFNPDRVPGLAGIAARWGQKLERGIRKVFDPSRPTDERVGGGVDVAESAAEALLPMGPAAVGRSIATYGAKKAIPRLLGSIGAGVVGEYGGRKGAEALGAGEGVARAAGFVGGALPIAEGAAWTLRKPISKVNTPINNTTPPPVPSPVTVTPPAVNEIAPTPIRKSYRSVPEQGGLPLQPVGAEARAEQARLTEEMRRTRGQLPFLRETAKAQQRSAEVADPQMSLFITEPNEINGPLPKGSAPDMTMAQRETIASQEARKLNRIGNQLVAPERQAQQDELFKAQEQRTDKAFDEVNSPRLIEQEQGTLLTGGEIPVRGSARELYHSEVRRLGEMKKRLRELSKLSQRPDPQPEQGELWTTGEIPLSGSAEATRLAQIRALDQSVLSEVEQRRLAKETKKLEVGLYRKQMEFVKAKSEFLKATDESSPNAPAPAPVIPVPTDDIEAAALTLRLRAEAAQKAYESKSLWQRIRNFKRHMVDSTTYTDELLPDSPVGGGRLLPSEHFTNKYDELLNSDKIARGLMEKLGFRQLMSSLPSRKDIPLFGEYLIASRLLGLREAGKFVPDYSPRGWRTAQHGGDIAKAIATDQQLVSTYRNRYEPLAQKVTEMANSVLKMLVDEGVVGQKEAQKALDEHPSYVILQRMFTTDGAPVDKTKPGNLLTVSSQSVFKALEGGTTPIESPLIALQNRVESAVRLIHRNQSARLLASYAGFDDLAPALPEWKGRMKEIKFNPLNSNKTNVLSMFKEGKVRQFELVDPELAIMVKALERPQLPQALNMALRVARAQSRVITMVPSFVSANLFRDQGTALAQGPGKGVLAPFRNLAGSTKYFFDAMAGGEKYRELESRGALGSSFDIYGGKNPATLERLQASGQGRIPTLQLYARKPGEVFGAVERFLAAPEEATRAQQWKVGYDDAISRGLSEDEARIAGDYAARWTTANFRRAGDLGAMSNVLALFANARIQGIRASLRRVQQDPMSFALRWMTYIAAPVVGLTWWNVSDPKRRAIYEQLMDHTRDNNLLFITDNAKIDKETGRAEGVFMVPLPPGISDFAQPLRRVIEDQYKIDPIRTRDVLGDIAAGILPFSPLDDETVSTLIAPQARPIAEVAINKKFFPLGAPIVPESRLNRPLDQQFSRSTGDTFKRASEFLAKADPYVPFSTKIAPATLQHLSEGYLGRDVTLALNEGPLDALASTVTRRFYAPYAGGLAQRERKTRERSQ
jgi:hypothetical protein